MAPSSTVIDITALQKVQETAAKLAGKKPTTPKPSTPRVSALGEANKNKEANLSKDKENKENKIKFSIKTDTTATSSSGGSTAGGPNDESSNNKEPSIKVQPPSNSSNSSNPIVSISNNNGRTSSCVIDFKTVWFNFAAPPRAPITRKIDFTR